MPMPSSSSDISGTRAFCAAGWAGSSAISAARSKDRPLSSRRSHFRSAAPQIHSQQQRQRGWKLYSFHAPEVECIGKGKASAPYEVGVKASIVLPTAVAQAASSCCMPGRCRMTPTTATPSATSSKTPRGSPVARSSAPRDRGHGTENPRRVFISGQKRGVFGVIKRELRHRSAIEPIIGHLKAEGHLGRCYLKGRAGDAANVILSAVGHNFAASSPG
jgi:IS5 family transposase